MGEESNLGKFINCGCAAAGHTIVICEKHKGDPNFDPKAYKEYVYGAALKPTELKEGTKHDGGKPMMGLLPSTPLIKIAEVLTFGAKKYAAHNWRKGIKYSRVYDGLQRHLTAFNEGTDLDDESKLQHLAHAGCCLMFLLEYNSKPEQYKEFDDRYKPEGENK